LRSKPLPGVCLTVAAPSDFWVDIAHYDCWRFERYYFPDLGSAVDFYLEGWQKRQYFDSQGNSMGINHSDLYSCLRLVDGLSIHGAPLGTRANRCAQP